MDPGSPLRSGRDDGRTVAQSVVMTFTLAIVGRPNVGKSTLFNRLAGRKLAIVHDRPGVTRDRRYAEAQLGDLSFQIVDTAGFEEAGGGLEHIPKSGNRFSEEMRGHTKDLEAGMRGQTEAAIAGADAALFVIDAREGITALDEIFA